MLSSWRRLATRAVFLKQSTTTSARAAEHVPSRHVASFCVPGVHEPEYLNYLRPQIPFYPLVNIQVRGYDYAVLESYAQYLHRMSNKLGLNVRKCWCAPHITRHIETLGHESQVVQSSYELSLYERNLQVECVSGKVMSLLVEILHRSLPTGVYLSVHEHDEEIHEKSRYIVDHELLQYKEELQALVNIKKDYDEEPAVKKR